MRHAHLFVYCLGLLLQPDGGVVLVTKTFWFAKIKICTIWPFTPRKSVPAQCKASIKIWIAFLLRSKFNLTKSLITPICSAARGSWNQGDLTGIWSGSDGLFNVWLIHPCITNCISNCIIPLCPFLHFPAYFPFKLAIVGRSAQRDQEVTETQWLNKLLEDALAPACAKKPKGNQLSWSQEPHEIQTEGSTCLSSVRVHWFGIVRHHQDRVASQQSHCLCLDGWPVRFSSPGKNDMNGHRPTWHPAHPHSTPDSQKLVLSGHRSFQISVFPFWVLKSI